MDQSRHVFFAKVRFVGSSRIASTTTTSHLVSRGYPLAELTRNPDWFVRRFLLSTAHQLPITATL